MSNRAEIACPGLREIKAPPFVKEDAFVHGSREKRMFGHSSVHFQLNWVKERIDEMDAALASLERSAGKVKSQSGSDAKRLIAGLKKHRARFAAIVKKQAKENDAAWQRSKAQLEAEWKKFESQTAHQFKTAERHVGQRAAFRRASGAQARAWRGAVERLQDMASSIVPARRTDFAATIRQIKADAAKAQVRMRRLGRSGSASWSTMRVALAKSRDAFDRANQKASDAIQRALKN